VGGSLFRIYRDVRFSKDKSPYKTNTGLHFRHEAAKDAHAPGFYLHLEPGRCFAGIGIWHPDAATARTIRQAIVDDPASWKKAAHRAAFRKDYALVGDSLKRPPRGYEEDHPAIDDLKRKDHIVVVKLSQKEVTGAGFAELVAQRFRLAAPYVGWLTKTIGLPF